MPRVVRLAAGGRWMSGRGRGWWRGRRAGPWMASAIAALLIAGLLAAPAVPAGASAGTPSVALATFTADATGQTGAYQVPAGNVPAAAFQPSSATSGSSVEAISFFHSSFFHSSFFHSSFFHSSFFHSSFFHSGLADTSFFHSSFFHSSFFHSPLDTTLLSDIPLLYPDPCGNPGATPPEPACTGWLGLIHDTHSALEGQPLQMVTLLDVIDDPQVGPVLKQLPTGDIDLTHTPLGDLPFAALAL